MRSLLMVLAAVPVLAQAQGEPRAMPLDEAVRLARQNAPAAIQARNSIRQSAGAVRQRYAAFLPSLSFSSRVNSSEGTRLNADGTALIPQATPWRGSHSYNSSLNIFDGGQRYFELQRARADVDAAESAEITQIFTVALNVKQQYFAVLAAREQEAAARAQLGQAEQGLRAASARVAAGAATLGDSLQSVIQVGNAQLALLQAENAFATANASLSRLVGSAEIVTAVASDTAAVETLSLSDDELLDLAERGPAVQQARASHRAARQGIRSSWTQYLPTLSLGLGWNYTGADSVFRLMGSENNKSISTSFSVSFPIFNGLNREQQALTASIAEDNAEAQLRDARLNARQQLIQQRGNFRTAEARMRIQAASIAAAEENLRVQQQRYNLGAGTLLELITAQTTLNTARQGLIQARLDARTAKAQIEALVGRDL